MHALQLLGLSGLLLAGNVALADKFDDNVPARCWDVCGPVVDMARQCENMHRGSGDDDDDDDADDRAEMRCICDWNQAPTLVPLCQACIGQNRTNIGNVAQNGTNVHHIAQNGTVVRPGNNRDDDDDDDDHDDDRNVAQNGAQNGAVAQNGTVVRPGNDRDDDDDRDDDGHGDDDLDDRRKKKRDDDDVFDILRFCNFPTTTYNPAAPTRFSNTTMSSSGISSTGPGL